MKTLILNKDFTPISIVPWTHAFCLVYKGVAFNVDFYQDKKVKDGKGNFYPVPAVICLKKHVPHNYNIKKKFSRSAIYKRDRFLCQYCGIKCDKESVTIDHILPKSKYIGCNKTSYFNCVTSCKRCNTKKADKTCEEAGMFPISKPYQPTHIDLLLSDIQNVPSEWGVYIYNEDVFKMQNRKVRK